MLSQAPSALIFPLSISTSSPLMERKRPSKATHKAHWRRYEPSGATFMQMGDNLPTNSLKSPHIASYVTFPL